MPIRLLLQHDQAFDPDDVAALTAAFDIALGKLGLINRDDPATLALAERIIALAKHGERDPERLAANAVASLSR